MVRLPAKLATPEEVKEAKYVGIKRVVLRYLKNSKQMGAWAKKIDPAADLRMWDLIEPRLPNYNYTDGYPTFTLEGLRQVGVL